MTFTPRLLLVDHKTALKHLPQDGGLYTDHNSLPSTNEVVKLGFQEQQMLWEPELVSVIKSEPIEKPEYQKDLNETNAPVEEKEYDFRHSVDTWTDFMNTRYHPRSFNLLKTVSESNEQVPFDCFSSGTQIWADEDFEDDFGDRVRQFIEECNNCQGFQTLFDCTDGFSGLSIKCLEHLQDEYGKSSLTIPIFSPNATKFGTNVNEAMADSIRVINTALTYSHLVEHSSLILPLSTMSRGWRKINEPRLFPHFDYDPHNLYETSAILATYLDTISLRYRVNERIDSCHLAGFCSDLTNYGRKLAAAGLSFPFDMSDKMDLIDCLDQFDGQLFTQLSPNSAVGTDRIVQSVSVRGISEKRIKSLNPAKVVERQRKMAAYRCDSVSEMFQLYFQCSNYASLAHVSALQNGMPTKKPFPIERFDDRLNSTGFLNEFASVTNDKQQINSIPVLATAQCSNDLADTIESLHREASRIKISKIHRFKETGFESDEFVDILEKLLEFKDCYDDGFEL